VLSKLE